MRKWMTLLVFAAGLSASAQAVGQEFDEELVFDDRLVDWEEAYDYAEVIDTYKEGGEEWVTLYDKEQGMMWSMPAGTSKEEFLESAGLDEEELGGRACILEWPLPHHLRISDDSGSQTYYFPTEFEYITGGANYKKWRVNGDECWSDVDGYVRTYVKSISSYCALFDGRYWDQEWDLWLPADEDQLDCWGSSPYYIRVYEADTIDNYAYCNSLQDIGVTQTWFYGCSAWRKIWIHYRYKD